MIYLKFALKKRARILKITPYLWFESKAEETVNFYVSIFRDSKILDIGLLKRAYEGE